ncbi:MAG: hypothetical protein ACLPX7_15390 [Xanthobacteraceae bacterium]
MALHVIMQLVTADVTLEAGGEAVDGTLGVAICASRIFVSANALVDAAALIAAATIMTTPRMTASITEQAGL